MTNYQVDEKVVYLHDHSSSSPDPSGKNVFASQKGEQYQFQIEKYWVISRLLHNERVEAVSRGGKTYVVDCHDPRLRKATWWERFFKAKSFPGKTRS